MAELAEIEVIYLHDTPDGLCVKNEWVPEKWLAKQFIEFDGDYDDVERNEEITISAPQWYLEKKGLV